LAGLSLKARAIALLSRREHSRLELRRKLQAHAEAAEELDAVLDELERGGWLSNQRFASSLVHRVAERQGSAKIVQTLREHGVASEDIAPLQQTLEHTEFQRAHALWQRKFNTQPEDDRARAKQIRFLMSRGFSYDIIRRIHRGEQPDPTEGAFFDHGPMRKPRPSGRG